MALYRATIHKRLILAPQVQWSNVYMLDTSNAVTAGDNAEAIAAFEADAMYNVAQVFRVSTRPKLGGVGQSRDVSLTGVLVAPSPDDFLPLWNVVLVTFGDALGRPEKKYFRAPLHEASVDGSSLTPGFRTSVETAYAAPLATYPFYVGPNGEAITSHTVSTRVQMRQVSWSRRSRPGFHRGYVPN